MLIDLSIVALVSVLYYLLCSRSRIVNLIAGMILIFIFCWAVGINIKTETETSELEFLIIVIIINIWINIHSHHLVQPAKTSRMNRLHHHKHSDHIYAVRNRLNNFRLKGIQDRFRATPQIYLRTVKHQVTQLNDYIQKHSNFRNLDHLITSLKVLPSEIDNINYHLDLPMQINFPHGLKRLIHQYYQILSEYHVIKTDVDQDQKIANFFNYKMADSSRHYTYLYVNLRFPYQRLIHDRIKHLIDLLVINSKGIFAFTLLNCNSKVLHVNKADQISSKELDPKPSHDLRPVINLRDRINVDYDTVNALIPKKINLRPKVGVICTNSHIKINLKDRKFNVIRPQDLSHLMNQLQPILTPFQIKEIANKFRDCISRDQKYEWQVFNTHVKKTVSDLLWYQDQVKKLDHKLMF